MSDEARSNDFTVAGSAGEQVEVVQDGVKSEQLEVQIELNLKNLKEDLDQQSKNAKEVADERLRKLIEQIRLEAEQPARGQRMNVVVIIGIGLDDGEDENLRGI